MPESFRFDVAFSFAGPHRDKVRAIAELVASQLGQEKVFFDEWYEHEILGDEMDVLLQRIYHEQSQMVVADLSDEYADRPWTKAEARAIRALRFDLDPARDETGRLRLLNARFGKGIVAGVFKTTAYLDGVSKTAEQCANLILKRFSLLQQRMDGKEPEKNGNTPQGVPASVSHDRFNAIFFSWFVPVRRHLILYLSLVSAVLLLGVLAFGVYRYAVRTDTQNRDSRARLNRIAQLVDTAPSDTSRDPRGQILDNAAQSAIAKHQWRESGLAPIGYIKGMAAAYALVYCNLKLRDPASLEMAKAASADDPTSDALSHLDNEFVAARMRNETDGADTLRHLFVLLTSLGMEESGGRYFAGRDPARPSDDAEAGLFQSSYSAAKYIPLSQSLMSKYTYYSSLLDVFQEGVLANERDLAIVGTGPGFEFQRLSKQCPAFAVEFAAVGLRKVKSHWGPIVRKHVEIRPECDDMFKQVQELIDRLTNGDPAVLQSIRSSLMGPSPISSAQPKGQGDGNEMQSESPPGLISIFAASKLRPWAQLNRLGR